MYIIVRFTRENVDDVEIASRAFPHLDDPEMQLIEQFKTELDENVLLRGHWSLLHHEMGNEQMCLWLGFNWTGTTQDFRANLQDTYNKYGMAGRFHIIEAHSMRSGGHHQVRQWQPTPQLKYRRLAMLFLAETILNAAGFRHDQNQDTWVVPAVLRPVVTVDCGGLCLMDALLQVHDVLEAWGCTYNNFAIRGRYLSLVGLTKA